MACDTVLPDRRPVMEVDGFPIFGPDDVRGPLFRSVPHDARELNHRSRVVVLVLHAAAVGGIDDLQKCG